jgi:EmrB/QacA subfamily drug resistance transporter
MAGERTNPPAEELYARKWQIFGVTMIGLFMALIDVTIVNISIPTLQDELHASVDTVSWVLNAYNIVFAVLLVSMGRLADQFGRKTFFLIGMTIFTIGSLLCAISWSIDALIGFRVIQAVGAGILAPLALATTALVFPPKQRGMGLALMAVVANVAAAIGPVLGGVLLEVASWHWIFLINVPIGIVGILLAFRVMPETYDLSSHQEVDWWGMVLTGGAVFTLTFALVEANSHGWGSPEIVGLLVASVVLTGAFAISQRWGRFPMLTRSLVTNRQFMGASAAMLLFATGLMGMLFLAVIAFVNLWGYSELDAAFAISPVAVTGFIVTPFIARIADRVPPRLIAIPALLCVAGGLLWFSTIPAKPDYLKVLPALILTGFGIGMLFPAVNVGAMGSIGGQELGLGSGIVNTSRQVGFALGVAILVAVFTGTLTNQIDDARTKVVAVAKQSGLDRAQTAAVLKREFRNPSSGQKPLPPRNRIEARALDLSRNAARDAFSTGFEVAALAALLALPFTLPMRRTPQLAGARETAAAAAG